MYPVEQKQMFHIVLIWNYASVLAHIVGPSPSPPDSRAKMREVPIRVEASDRSPHVIPLTVPGAEYGKREKFISNCETSF